MKLANIILPDFPIILAPMEDVTDPPFRKICKKMGADMMYTEFISSEGLIREARKSTKKLDFDTEERPIGIQIFGHNIESMIMAARFAEEANPDLIDINFGCPVRKVVNKGAGAAMLKDVPLMVKMTGEVVRAVKLPVTVKTRLGWDQKNRNIVEVAERLQDVGIKALSIHGRTAVQRSSEPADWTLIGEIKKNPRIKIPVFGNGDVTDARIAADLVEKYPVDGLMIGRASIGYPWIIREIRHYLDSSKLLPMPNIDERISVCREHLQLSIAWKGEKVAIHEMRKHYGGYFRALPDFKAFRIKLMQAQDLEQTEVVINEIYKYYID